MSNKSEKWTLGCFILFLVAVLGGWFAGCYVWIKTVQPVQFQVPRDN